MAIMTRPLGRAQADVTILAWMLSTTIVGTANPGHLAGNIAIAEKGPLPADLYEEAKKILPQ